MTTKWLDLTKEAFEASSAFVDANYRQDWDYSIKAFRNEHAAGSKYLSPEYASRSRLFRPKTRSIIRKNEAAAAVALFSNMEVVDLQPGNPDDPMSVASRDAMKALLEYRLSRTIPWFETCMGGVQDAQTQGAVVSYQYWEYEKKNGVLVKDKPCIDLRPIENIRLDGGASWVDPVGTSPYFFDIIPMYVCQVRGMMKTTDDKTGAPKWKKHDDAVILRAKPDSMDSTRQARLGKQQDPQTETTGLKDYDIVWVMRCFMRNSINDDYFYYSLGTEELLTDPVPLEKAYFHGIRPYEMGYAILETHRTFKSSMPVLVRPLQQETTEVANQRIDNVKFVLNKRWLVARGRQVDVQSLVRNVAGGVTLTTDPKTDVQESNWPDVTSSAYAEQDRLSADFDDLAGNFTPSTRVANNAVNDTLGGSKLAAQGAGLMTDYLLRTIMETWAEKALRQVLKLEAAYETDEKILALCANKAKLFPRFGISAITDQMLKEEVSLTLNVGMGSTSPNERFQKAMMFFGAANQLIMTAPPGANVSEQIKELGSNAGFRDATRFYGEQDPRLAKAVGMVQQLQKAIESKQMDLQSAERVEQQKLASNEKIKGAEVKVNAARIDGDLKVRYAELEVEKLKVLSDARKNEGETDTADIDAAIQEIHKLIAVHTVKINSLLEVQAAKNEAKAAKQEAKQSGEVAKVEKQSKDDTAAKMQKQHDQFMEGINKILQALAAKKTIKLLKKDGQTTGAEVGIA
jgi:hypothetical protein